MDFSTYLSDVLDLQEGLLSEQDLAKARASYAAWLKKADERRRWKAGEKVLNARAVAALFGGRALTGTAKQKEWGESIRAEKLRGMTESQAALACAPDGLGRSARFWIENRTRSSAEIGAFFEKQKSLLAEARALREAGKADEYAAAAKAYNELTAAWGFN